MAAKRHRSQPPPGADIDVDGGFWGFLHFFRQSSGRIEPFYVKVIHPIIAADLKGLA